MDFACGHHAVTLHVSQGMPYTPNKLENVADSVIIAVSIYMCTYNVHVHVYPPVPIHVANHTCMFT